MPEVEFVWWETVRCVWKLNARAEALGLGGTVIFLEIARIFPQ